MLGEGRRSYRRWRPQPAAMQKGTEEGGWAGLAGCRQVPCTQSSRCVYICWSPGESGPELVRKQGSWLVSTKTHPLKTCPCFLWPRQREGPVSLSPPRLHGGHFTSPTWIVLLLASCSRTSPACAMPPMPPHATSCTHGGAHLHPGLHNPCHRLPCRYHCARVPVLSLMSKSLVGLDDVLHPTEIIACTVIEILFFTIGALCAMI